MIDTFIMIDTFVINNMMNRIESVGVIDTFDTKGRIEGTGVGVRIGIQGLTPTDAIPYAL